MKVVKQVSELLFTVMLLIMLALGTAFAETLTMPSNLQVIGEEAFYDDISIERVILPAGILRIDARAFARSGLKRINLPATLEYIAPDAFDGCSDFICTGTADSYASGYCEKLDIPFVPYPEPVSQISLNTSQITLEVGDSYKIVVAYFPSNASHQYAYFSVDNNCVSIDAAGVITAKSQGSALVTVTAADGSRKTATISVTVNEPPMISVASSGSGNTRTISVTANKDWSAKSDAAWISLDQTSGSSGTSSITATLATNPSTTASRSGTLTFTCGTKTATVTITQAAADSVSISPTAQTGGNPDGGGISPTITANGAWTAVSDSSWLTLSKTSGSSGSTKIDMAYAKNTSAASRTATVTVTCGTAKATYKLTQNAHTITASVSGSGITRTISVSGNGSWTAKTDVTWITLNKTSGSSGTSSITATLTINPSTTASRSGTVTFTCGTKTVTVTITQEAATVAVAGVSLNASSKELTVGSSFTLTATVSPSNATNKTVTWKSSNTSVATVNSSGLVSAVGAGSATITVTTSDGSKTATCAVTVKIPVTGVTLSKTSAELKIGGTVTLTATVAPSNATNKSVTWSSSNTSVATVSNGTVTGKTAGTATITVKTSDSSKTATCTVTVYGKPAISFPSYPTSVTTSTTGVDIVAKVTGGKGPYTGYWTMYKGGTRENGTNTYTISTNTTNWPINQFGSAGSFQAELTITDALGQTTSAKTGTMKVTQVNPVSSAPVINSITTSNDAISLKWNTVANAVSYKITTVHTGSGWTGTYTTSTNSWTGDWFGNGTYSVTVTAIGDASVANNSKTSASKSITVKANKITSGPTPSISVSGTTATITWPAVANATWYEVELYTSAGYANLLNKGDSQKWYAQKVGGSFGSDPLHNKTSFSFTGLSSGVYMVKVAACNAGGYWAFGEVRDFVIGTATNYPVKEGPAVTLTVNGSSIHATWNAVENAAIYRACLYTASGYPNNVIYKDLYTRNNWADFSGLPDGTYYLAVAGEGTFSDPDGSKGGWKFGAAKSTTVGTTKQTKWLHGVPNYLQSNPNWAGVSIGTGTIGSIGCTTTCIAMSESYRTGTTITPDIMAGRINYSGNSVTWGNLGYSFYGQDTYNVQDVMSYAYKAINNGKPLIVGGYSYENGVKKTHWVIIVGYADLDPNNMSASCFQINDPGSSSRTNLQQFLNYRGTIDAVCTYGSPIK